MVFYTRHKLVIEAESNFCHERCKTSSNARNIKNFGGKLGSVSALGLKSPDPLQTFPAASAKGCCCCTFKK